MCAECGKQPYPPWYSCWVFKAILIGQNQAPSEGSMSFLQNFPHTRLALNERKTWWFRLLLIFSGPASQMCDRNAWRWPWYIWDILSCPTPPCILVFNSLNAYMEQESLESFAYGSISRSRSARPPHTPIPGLFQFFLGNQLWLHGSWLERLTVRPKNAHIY